MQTQNSTIEKQNADQPILILREGVERSRGKEALNRNIMAAKAVANAVRTTLGPNGMDKMLVNGFGDITITNDGATILTEMDIEHPAARMVAEVARAQDDEVGDGTTSAAVFTGDLLKFAEDLLNNGIHPTIIAGGYRQAACEAVKILNTLRNSVSENDDDNLMKIAGTAMTGKGAEIYNEKLANLVVKAVKSVIEEDGRKIVDVNNIKIEKKVGGRLEDSLLIKGMVLENERAHIDMPRTIDEANIAFINGDIEFKKTEVAAKINITSPDQIQMFREQEEIYGNDLVDKIQSSGANVVLCQRGIDDMVLHYLVKAGILAVKRVNKSDFEKTARATRGNIITNVNEISETDLGHAQMVEEKKTGGDTLLYITECENPKAVSIVLRGGTEHVVDSIEHAINDAIRVVGVAIEDGTVVAGGGSPEVELSIRLREYAATLKGRKQLAVNKFADALEVVPRTLAENAGLNPIDTLVELKSRHEMGDVNAGIDGMNGNVTEMTEIGVIEPLKVKVQAINSATDAAVMIMRIDDIISFSGEDQPDMPPGIPAGSVPQGGFPPSII